MKVIWALSSIAFPAQKKSAKYTAYSLTSSEKDKSFALLWSSPLNLGATESPKRKN